MTYRLISKDRDYYDSMFHAYGFDPKKVWVRKKETLNLSNESPPIISHLQEVQDYTKLDKGDNWNGRFHPISGEWIGVAGKLYRIVPMCKSDATYEEQYKTGPQPIYPGYNNDNVNYEKYVYCNSFKKYHSRHDEIDHLKAKCVTKFEFESDTLFKHVDAPIIHINQAWKTIRITKNPNLSWYGFSVVMDAFEVFTAVEQYLESTLMAPNEPSQTSNDDRIVSAGFDMKQSFRHRK